MLVMYEAGDKEGADWPEISLNLVLSLRPDNNGGDQSPAPHISLPGPRLSHLRLWRLGPVSEVQSWSWEDLSLHWGGVSQVALIYGVRSSEFYPNIPADSEFSKTTSVRSLSTTVCPGRAGGWRWRSLLTWRPRSSLRQFWADISELPRLATLVGSQYFDETFIKLTELCSVLQVPGWELMWATFQTLWTGGRRGLSRILRTRWGHTPSSIYRQQQHIFKIINSLWI